jgi:hypothetical protein
MMSNDSYTEFSSQSWFSRIGESIKGILFGFILFVVAFPLLWWNEGRSVERYNSLKEGQGIVISVSADSINPANHGKLVHTQGMATTQETLTDDVFSVSVAAIKLQRLVAMYQWKETEKTETHEEVGGTKTTKKTYTYTEGWSNSPISSNSFKQSSGHDNPPMLYKDQIFQAQNVSLGAFKLNPGQVSRLSGEQDFSVQGVDIPKKMAGKKMTVTGTGFYLGDNPTQPHIGDLQISFKVLKPANVSIVAQQQGDSFSAYQTQAGSDIDLLEMGLLTASAMFATAHTENTVMTWGIRVGGFLLMWIGLSMLLKPLSVLAAVVPFLGDLIAMGTGIFAFLLSLPCTMMVIAVAWIAYRPLLAGGLLTVAVLAVVAMKFMPRRDSHVAHA